MNSAGIVVMDAPLRVLNRVSTPSWGNVYRPAGLAVRCTAVHGMHPPSIAFGANCPIVVYAGAATAGAALAHTIPTVAAMKSIERRSKPCTNAVSHAAGPAPIDHSAARALTGATTFAPAGTVDGIEHFEHHGHQIAYREFGTGKRTCVLIHGLLLSQRMHEPLARDLAARGQRALTIDLLGHGESDRPEDSAHYSMPAFGEQVVALLDHVGADEAVIAGTSLGANTALEAAALAPRRTRGLVIEMPVLDHALVASIVAFTPLLVGLSVAAPLARVVALAARAVPRGLLPFYADVGLDTIRQEPGPSAAVLRGLFLGRGAPPPADRREITAPALVIGHKRDPVHPLTDAGMLADELRNARLFEANSILELRLSPQRLTGEIGDFLDTCWKPAKRTRRAAAG